MAKRPSPSLSTRRQPGFWSDAMSFSEERAGPKPLLLKVAEAFMAATLTIMVIAVFSNVVLRYAFSTGLVIYDELSRLLFVWLVCVGSVVAASENKHLKLGRASCRERGSN